MILQKYRAIAVFSKKLSYTELSYTVSDRELLALLRFLELFSCYFEGSTFAIIKITQVQKYSSSQSQNSAEENKDGHKRLKILEFFLAL